MLQFDEHVGVVVIGRNEGERLKRCLNSIPEGTPVVYVDSGSTDGSAQYAESRGAMVVHLDLNRPFTAARARNAGVERLLAELFEIRFVQFVDGDCELENEWLQKATAFLQQESSIAAVCGRRRERHPRASLYNKMCDEEWDTPVGEATACGGDALFRVAALRETGYYDPALIAGEEPELCHRLRLRNWGIWRIDCPMTIHDADMHHFSQWWKRAVRSGFGYAQVWHKTSAGSSTGLYQKELTRAFGWALGVPILGIALSLILGPGALLLIPALWLAQFLRLARRSGIPLAFHLLVGKAAESWGAIRYAWGTLMLRPAKAIYYK